MKSNYMSVLLIIFSVFSFSHDAHQTKGSFKDKFRQLEEKYPDPDSDLLSSLRIIEIL